MEGEREIEKNSGRYRTNEGMADWQSEKTMKEPRVKETTNNQVIEGNKCFLMKKKTRSSFE